MKHALLFLLLIVVMALPAFAQALIFNQGDTVQTPDGRTGKIESFKNQEMAKVRFGENDTQYFMLTDLKVVQPPKPPRTGPQETFHVGETVEDERGKQLIIESINGNSAKVRYGVGRYNVYDEPLENLVSAKTAALRREQAKTQKIALAQFEDESRPFLETLALTARAYNPKYREAASFTINPALTAKVRKDLEGLHAVCQKYPNLTSPPSADPNNIRENPAELCKMAENPAEMTAKATGVVAGVRGEQNISRWIRKVTETMGQREGYVKDDVQMLLYNRAEWERTELASVRKKYASLGDAVPPQVLAPLNEKVDELKAQIARDAPPRSWKQPPYSDAALEAMVRQAYPAQYPGVKVFKTGMTFTTWKAEDDTSLVGSGTDYKVYRTTKGAYRYKLGLALVKLPNQPFCQIRDFQVQQNKAGAGYSAAKLHLPLGYTGIFVKCQ